LWLKNYLSLSDWNESDKISFISTAGQTDSYILSTLNNKNESKGTRPCVFLLITGWYRAKMSKMKTKGLHIEREKEEKGRNSWVVNSEQRTLAE
jgi:hypothetical protein